MKNVALFVGNDVFSWLACQDAIGVLNKKFDLTVYFPQSKPVGRTQEPEIRKLGLYERKVLNDFIFPFISKNHTVFRGSYKSPLVFLADAGVNSHRVDDINDGDFMRSLDNMDAVISLRCYQKFSADYVAAFSRCGKMLWNLHPGDLPSYRGVMTLFRSMMNGEKKCALTLHEMDECWDSGPVIARLSAELRYDQSFLENMIFMGVQAGAFLASHLMQMESRGSIIVERQGGYRYWGFPDAQTLMQAEQAGIKLIDHDAIRQKYLKLFVGEDFHPLADQFCAEFDDFIRENARG